MEEMETLYKMHSKNTSNPSESWEYYTAMDEIINAGQELSASLEEPEDTVEIFFESAFGETSQTSSGNNAAARNAGKDSSSSHLLCTPLC